MHEHICEGCGVKFLHRTLRARFHDRKCAAAFNRVHSIRGKNKVQLKSGVKYNSKGKYASSGL